VGAITLAMPIAMPPGEAPARDQGQRGGQPGRQRADREQGRGEQHDPDAPSPARSAIGPAIQAPTAEPIRAAATVRPRTRSPAPNWALMASTAPLMTAVS
jgi:hypothetical protein